MTKKTIGLIVGGVLIFSFIGAMLFNSDQPQKSADRVIHIVAAENVWGSLASQIGGEHVQVTNIITDPNADPHEYEATAEDARQIADADIVILTGAGYDSWAEKLVQAGGKPGRQVLNIAQYQNKHVGDNPHLWYRSNSTAPIANSIEGLIVAMVAESGTDALQDVTQRLEKLSVSLTANQQHVSQIKEHYAHTKVASTEDVFGYLADEAGLDVITPPAFTHAVSEGTDPPTASVVEFEKQLRNKEAKVLIYNTQTVTPLTERMKKLAEQQGIPVVGMTETIQPPNALFQDWMGSQITALADALASSTRATK